MCRRQNDKKEPPVVSVRNTSNGIRRAVFSALDAIGPGFEKGEKILIKPNVGRNIADPRGVNTNPEIVRAVADYLIKKYSAEIYLGDSPIIATVSRTAFVNSGFEKILEDDRINFLNLDDKKPVVAPIKRGLILKNIRLTGYLDLFDRIVSIPVIKMHIHTGASLGIKNCKGLIYKRDKIKLHHLKNPDSMRKAEDILNSEEYPLFFDNFRNPPDYNTGRPPVPKELDVAISDLFGAVKPDLTVIDGTYSQEGMGPSAGDPVRTDLVVASTDPLAADITAFALVSPGRSLRYVPHLALISARYYDGKIKSPDDFETDPSDLLRFVTPLKFPPNRIEVKYPNVRLYDRDSCSACLSTVFLFIKNNKEFLDRHFTSEQPLNLAIGKGLSDTDLPENIFLIGNCTACRRKDGIFIPGCTPVQSTILRTVKGYLKKGKEEGGEERCI